LKPGAPFLFNAWDSLAENDFARAVHGAAAAFYPANPPAFFARTPHGYHDEARIKADLTAAGFTHMSIRRVAQESRAASARDAAVAYCQGTPMRMEIAARGADDLGPVTAHVEAALAQRFGTGAITGKMQALVVQARARRAAGPARADFAPRGVSQSRRPHPYPPNAMQKRGTGPQDPVLRLTGCLCRVPAKIRGYWPPERG